MGFARNMLGVEGGFSVIASPTYLSGLQSWHRAGEGYITDESGRISQWSDISGNGKHFVQTSPDKRPSSTGETLNQINCVNFDGVDDFLEAEAKSTFNHMHSGDSTMIAVLKVTDEANTNGVYGIMGSNSDARSYVGYSVKYDDRSIYNHNNAILLNVTYGNHTITVVSAIENNYAPVSGEYFVLAITTNVDAAKNNRARFWLNGAKTAPLVYNSSIGDPSQQDSEYTFRLGIQGFEYAWLPGAIAEVMTYNRAIADAEMEQITTYLQDRYGLGT